MTRHYPDLGSASDWLNQINIPHGTTNQRHYQDLEGDMSLVVFLCLFLRRHSVGKPVLVL